MIFWITSSDGALSFRVEAIDTDTALDALAAQYGYQGYSDFSRDLGYNATNLAIALVSDDRRAVYDAQADRQHLFEEQRKAELWAFKTLRKLAGG